MTTTQSAESMDIEVSEPNKQTTDIYLENRDLLYEPASDYYDDDDYGPYHCTVDDDDDVDSVYYIDDDDEQGHFRDSCFYGPDDELKVCISSFASNFSWKEPSSGTSWIGVYGIGVTCSASMDRDPLKRPIGHHLVCTTILHMAVTDMKDESSAIRQRMIGHCSQTGSKTGPFAVVSIAPDARHVPLESNIEGAISFLMEKLKGRQSLTVDETEQIVVCAMKYLFGSVCRSSEMKTWCSGEFNWTLNPGQIEHHLNAIDWTTTTATKDLPASFSSLHVSCSGSGVDVK